MPITIPICDQCGLSKQVMVPMVPGRDGKEWFLCGPCWIDGVIPMKLGMFGKVTEISDPHLATALEAASERTAGLINMDPGKSKKTRKRSP